MPITIKKGRAKDKPRPAPVPADAPKAKAKKKPDMADRLREATMSDPRYKEAMARPNNGDRATKCKFCSGHYIVPCDSEEKDFCMNHLFATGQIKSIEEWYPLAEKGNQLKLARHAERVKKGEA